MSLDIYFHGQYVEDTTTSLNITHNLNKLVDECGKLTGSEYYKLVWRPEELFNHVNGSVMVEDVLCQLPQLLNDLIKHQTELEQYLPDNGWGTYTSLINFICDYIKLCYTNKHAKLYCCR